MKNKKIYLVILLVLIAIVSWVLVYLNYFNRAWTKVVDNVKSLSWEQNTWTVVIKWNYNYKRDYLKDDIYNIRTKTTNVVDKILYSSWKEFRSNWFTTDNLKIKLLILRDKDVKKTELDQIANIRINWMITWGNIYDIKPLLSWANFTGKDIIWVAEYDFKWKFMWYNTYLEKLSSDNKNTNNVFNTVKSVFIDNWYIFSCNDKDVCDIINVWQNPFLMEYFDRNFDKPTYSLSFFLWHAFRVYNMLYNSLPENLNKISKVDWVITSDGIQVPWICTKVERIWWNPHTFTYCIDSNKVPVYYNYVWVWWTEFPWITFYWEWIVNNYDVGNWDMMSLNINWKISDGKWYKSFEKRILENYNNMISARNKYKVDTSSCLNIWIFDNKIACINAKYIDAMIENNDINLCENIQDSSWKYFCYVEYLKMNPSTETSTICNRIYTDDRKWKCVFEIEEYRKTLASIKSLVSKDWYLTPSKTQVSMVIRSMYDRNKWVCKNIAEDYVKKFCEIAYDNFMTEAKLKWFEEKDLYR